MHSRRSFFRLLAAAPALRLGASQKLIVRSANPEDFEMPLDGFQTWLTPVDRFFVRTHLYRPAVKMDDWRLRIGGEVEGPLALAMGDLRKLPRVELVSVLECAGNGRGLYRPTVPGIQWRYGAVGNARWAGVRLPDVLKRARLKPTAKHILFNGADVPMGTVPDFARSLPVEKAMHPDTLLAWEMNGAPLTPSHGFPLRLVAPGWAGDSWVKWVTEIQALEHEYDGFFMKTAYRRPVKPVAPGTAVDPSQMVPVTDIKIKSLIASPQEGEVLGLAPVRVQGAAWSGAAAGGARGVFSQRRQYLERRAARPRPVALRVAALGGGLEAGWTWRLYADGARHRRERRGAVHGTRVEPVRLSVERGAPGAGPGGGSLPATCRRT